MVRALLDLDAIALRAATVVDVVLGDHRVGHDDLAVVGTEVHGLTGGARVGEVMEVVARDEEMARIAGVENLTGTKVTDRNADKKAAGCIQRPPSHDAPTVCRIS